MLLLLPVALAATSAPPAVVRAARRELQAALPACPVRRVDRGHLGATCADGRQVLLDLDRLRVACETDEATCTRERGAMIRHALTGDAPTDLALVVPVVRARRTVDGTLALIERVSADGRDAHLEAPVHLPLSADIEILYMLDSTESARALNAGELAALDLAPDALHAATVPNCARYAGEVTREDQGGVEVWTGGFYLSSLVLDLARWDAEAAGKPLYMAVPARDTLVILHGEDVEALRQSAGWHYAHADDPVSPTILRWTGVGWDEI